LRNATPIGGDLLEKGGFAEPDGPLRDAMARGHGRYVAFQMAEIAIPRHMFQEILRLIGELQPKPPPTPA
jgi:hypothetical protein